MLTNKLKPLANIVQGKPLMAVFEINLKCNSKCTYCDLPLNLGRYELSRIQIKDIFTRLYKDGLRYVFLQGGELRLGPPCARSIPTCLL
ncbi:MAG: hypothetical protein AAF410_06725, partial [Pseudomonadota bacterium]